MLQLMIWTIFTAVLPASPQTAALAPCGVDAYEPNDERGRAKSTRGKPVQAATCATDEDWYWVRVEAGEVVNVRVEHHPNARFEAPAVFRPRARKPAGLAFEAPGVKRRRFVARHDGVHRIRVRSPEAVRAAYRLVVQTAPAKAPTRISRAGARPRAGR